MRISDWSSDVCSSDLMPRGDHRLRDAARAREAQIPEQLVEPDAPRRARTRHASLRPSSSSAASPAKGLCGEGVRRGARSGRGGRSEEHTSELQSLMRSSYAVFCLERKNKQHHTPPKHTKHTTTYPTPTKKFILTS